MDLLIFRAQGLQVAVVNNQNQAVLKSVTIRRDFGDYVEIDNGIKPGDLVILNPPDSLLENEKVRVIQPPSPPQSSKPS